MNLTAFHMYANDMMPQFRIVQPPHNTRSQATVRREVRRRSNLPKAVQRRLGFKCK